MDALSAAVCIEQGPFGITSNVLASGPIAGTEGIERLVSKSERAGHTKVIPSGRMGSVREIADATIFLFSDAGSYVNRVELVVDGGAWRTAGRGDGESSPFKYLDVLFGGKQITGVAGGKKAKL